ncbi:hypothetical protein A3K72_00900, partial [Candidatus Woesearchaeota archaeon RBG_13_36_6]
VPIMPENGSEAPLENAEDTNLDNMIDALMNNELDELPSPCDRVKEEQILVFRDHIIINLEDAEWATFTDTNSMDPVIDQGANAIEYVPKNESEICVGDIVSYESKYADGVLIHRVVETGNDSQGWYAVMKGDNNPYKDPGKIRFDQIKRVVVAIIY